MVKCDRRKIEPFVAFYHLCVIVDHYLILTQVQLAQKLGLTKSVISAYETGRRLPSYDILIHIARIYNVSTDYLLGLEHKQ